MQRRKFSREFKLEAVRLVRERGVAVAQAARDLRRWDEAEALYEAYLRTRPDSHQAMTELTFVRQARSR